VADGHWGIDAFNTVSEANPYGELNSIIEIEPQA
jgi:hypothetical protein